MKIANKPLNRQAWVIEETETLIRLLVKNEYFLRTPKPIIDRKINDLLNRELKKISLIELRKAAFKSLLIFYNKQYATLSRLNGFRLEILLALTILTDESKSPVVHQKARLKLESFGVPTIKLYGVPLRTYMDDYLKKEVKPIIDRLAEEYPVDPDDLSEREHRNSLRNRAEMEVRYNGHLEEIEGFKAKGVRLVIASVHADCSDRCAPWQGRVYSLDGTRGTTPDGRKYVPLEEATDVYYTTKAGKTYKNGLLGFNCRHYLVEYKDGFRFLKPNKATERAEYAITVKQRELERNVRKWRTEAVESKGVDKKRYEYAKNKAKEWERVYINYSKDHERAYYPSRTKII